MEPLITETGKKPPSSLSRIYTFIFNTETPVEQIVASYQSCGLFEYVEPDYILYGNSSESVFIPNDQYFYRQWPLHNDGTYTMGNLFTPKEDADIDMPEAWEIEQGDSAVVIAVLDAGCKMNHPELAGMLWINKGEIPGNNIDYDGNGYVDDIKGWDFINNDNDPTDDNGHGTGLAGIIGANSNNGIGFAGVNPNAKIMIIKILDSLKRGNTTTMIKGIEYAVKMKARIITLSLGGSNFIQIEHDFIEYADSNNVTIIAATGNNNTEKINFPAAEEKVIAVGATGPDDKRYLSNDTTGSNYGNEIDIIAPGMYICHLDETDENKYTLYSSGTSLSAAFVTGVASLLLSKNPKLTPAQIRDILQKSADDQVGDPKEDVKGWDKYYGWGRLNAYRALHMTSSVKKSSVQHRIVAATTKKILNINNKTILPGASCFSLNGTMIPAKKSRVNFAKGIYIYFRPENNLK
jgi:subtilisin family serine protease